MAAVHSCVVVSDSLRADVVCTRLVRVVRPIPEHNESVVTISSPAGAPFFAFGTVLGSRSAGRVSLNNRTMHVKVGFGERN